MAHIAIEGMDGVGKTTTCKLLAERLGYKFIEKNLRFLFDENDSFDNYFKIRDKVNANPDRLFTSWFYGLGNIYLYTMFKDEIMLGVEPTITPKFTICSLKNLVFPI